MAGMVIYLNPSTLCVTHVAIMIKPLFQSLMLPSGER
jgi:hypothetical protein